MCTCADVKTTQQYILEKIRSQPEFPEVCRIAHSDASCVEQWVENVLRDKDGPKKVLDVIYTEGPALEFLEFMTRIVGQSSKGGHTPPLSLALPASVCLYAPHYFLARKA